MIDKVLPPVRSDFEKLVIARSYIKELRVEKGELLAYIDELKDEIEKLNKVSNEVKIAVRADERVIELNNRIKKQKLQIDNQRDVIEDLIIKLNKK